MKTRSNKYMIHIALSVVFVLLMLVPCAVKQEIKSHLHIPINTHINKDVVTVGSCSSFAQTVENSVIIAKENTKIIGSQDVAYTLDTPSNISHCYKSERIKNRSSHDFVYGYSTPLFIHHRQLII